MNSKELEQMAQSEACTGSSEINFIHKIAKRTNELLQAFNSIENLTIGINKDLLPPKVVMEAKCEKDSKKPEGWFETHLAVLDTLFYQGAKIYDELSRLNRETRNDAK